MVEQFLKKTKDKRVGGSSKGIVGMVAGLGRFLHLQHWMMMGLNSQMGYYYVCGNWAFLWLNSMHQRFFKSPKYINIINAISLFCVLLFPFKFNVNFKITIKSKSNNDILIIYETCYSFTSCPSLFSNPLSNM
jgi:hypothetical protein